VNKNLLYRIIYFAFRLVLFLGLFLGSVACQSSEVSPTITENLLNTTATTILNQTNTPNPTPTGLPSKILLLSQDNPNDPELIALQDVLSELSEKDGYNFEIQNDLTAIQLDESIRLVVVTPPDMGLVNLAVANPDVQFLAVGIEGIQASKNVHTIGSGGFRPDQQGFLAGYLAAIITQDWRVGVIAPTGTVDGRSSRNGFGNGVKFYCGLCRPAYPPYFEYPVFAELTETASELEQQAAADIMRNNAVRTVYVFPGAGNEALLGFLGEAGINVIGGSTPPKQVKESWVATIRIDIPGVVKEFWLMLNSREQGLNLEAPLVITDQNSTLLSPGRQKLAEKVLADMLAGFIDTGVDITTGELR